MGSCPIAGYHLCSSVVLAIAENDIVHLRTLNYTISEEEEKCNGETAWNILLKSWYIVCDVILGTGEQW